MKKKKGLAHMLDIVYHLCEWKDNFCTSKPDSKKVCDPAIKSQTDEAVGRKLKPISQKKLTEIIISKER